MSVRLTPRLAVAVVTALSALGVGVPGAVAAGTARCADAVGRADNESRSPAEENVDPAALQDLLDFASSRAAASVRVYRHGCLIGTSRADAVTQDLPRSWNSASKAVNALIVGRAVALGYLSLDDPVSRWFPEADTAHGKILLRHLITMTSGLRVSLSGDTWTNSASDGVRIALHQAIEHEPGTYYSYQQHGLTLLLACVQKAVGRDVQHFAQDELFGELGIGRDQWFWVRDRAGWTAGWYGLVTSPRRMGRLGQLMLNDGVWNGERLLSHEFVQAAGSPTPTNGGYGYLMWTNRGDSYYTTEFPGRRFVHRPLMPSAPRDLYEFAGLGGQNVYIIPSLDMVIERSGEHPSRDNAPDYSRGGGGEYEWELFRMLNRAVTDADWGDPGPFQPLEPAPYDPGTTVDPEQGLAGIGLGDRAGGCNVAGCDGRVDFSGFQTQQHEFVGYGQGVATTEAGR